MALKTSSKVLLPTLLCGALLSPVPTLASVGDHRSSGPRDLWLDLNQPISEITPSGSMPLATAAITQEAGLASGDSRLGQGKAVRTPSFTERGPKAVLAVTAKYADPLSPGWRDFVFGADLQLDGAPTMSKMPESTDNGDNVVQRGLFNQVGQYKIQVDDRRPMCRVQGTVGAVSVTADTTLAAGSWYRVTCNRSKATLTLTVTQFASTGQAVDVDQWVEHGAMGSVRSTDRATPLSIGGKLTDAQVIAEEADQFNGLIDNVSLRIS